MDPHVPVVDDTSAFRGFVLCMWAVLIVWCIRVAKCRMGGSFCRRPQLDCVLVVDPADPTAQDVGAVDDILRAVGVAAEHADVTVTVVFSTDPDRVWRRGWLATCARKRYMHNRDNHAPRIRLQFQTTFSDTFDNYLPPLRLQRLDYLVLFAEPPARFTDSVTSWASAFDNAAPFGVLVTRKSWENHGLLKAAFREVHEVGDDAAKVPSCTAAAREARVERFLICGHHDSAAEERALCRTLIDVIDDHHGEWRRLPTRKTVMSLRAVLDWVVYKHDEAENDNDQDQHDQDHDKHDEREDNNHINEFGVSSATFTSTSSTLHPMLQEGMSTNFPCTLHMCMLHRAIEGMIPDMAHAMHTAPMNATQRDGGVSAMCTIVVDHMTGTYCTHSLHT